MFGLVAVGPEEVLAGWGVPVGVIAVVAVAVWVVGAGERLAGPARWLSRRLSDRQVEAVPTDSELAAWTRHLRVRMGELWVHGDRAPLRAAVADSPSTLQHLAFEADPALLHPSRRSATELATGEQIALDETMGAGELFELLDDSVLVVGPPGAGKSVLLWQVLRDRLMGRSDEEEQVPVLVELHRWSTVDSGVGVEPAFERFLVAELASPAIGVPAQHARALIAQNRLIYLLDGLDEMPEHLALRCLNALASFAREVTGQRRRSVMLTCREREYDDLISRRAAGTSGVANALRVALFPPEVVEEAMRRMDPSPGRLPEATRRLPQLARMLGTPLWLSIAEAVYHADPDGDPLAACPPDASSVLIEDALYAPWLEQRLEGQPGVIDHLAILATTMRANGQQTLYLESLQPSWLNQPRSQRLAWLLFGLASGLVVGLALALSAWLGLWLVSGHSRWIIDVLAFGLSFGLTGGAVFGLTERGSRIRVVAYRRWSWRSALTLRALADGMFFGVVFGAMLALLYAPSGRLADGVVAGLLTGTIFGLVAGPVLRGWVTVPAVQGRSADPMATIRRSVRHGLTVLLLAVLVGGLAVTLVGERLLPLLDPARGVLPWPANLIAAGVTFGALTSAVAARRRFGGGGSLVDLGLGAGISYEATRLAAAHQRLLPWDLVAFLDDACAVGVMYPAGPGYRFRHRTLADHLADGSRRRTPP